MKSLAGCRSRRIAGWNILSCLQPKSLRGLQRIDTKLLPPAAFVSKPVELAMVKSA
jgi:hypothetical protein